MQPAQQLDERGFSRAVFTAKRVDFSFVQIKGNILQRDDAGKTLRQIPRGKDGVHFPNNSASLWKPSFTTVSRMLPLWTAMMSTCTVGTSRFPLS